MTATAPGAEGGFVTAERKREQFYCPELDGLRFIAFFAVFVHHSLPLEHATEASVTLAAGWMGWLASITRAGAFGVDLFFLLSAYLITQLLLREHDLKGKIDVKAFYARRILRIWPLYFAFVIAAWLVVPLVLPRDHVDPKYLLGFTFLSGNWVCAVSGYPASVIAPLWSVSIEEQFYLSWPVIVRFVSRRRLVIVLLTMIVVAMATRAILFLAHVPHPGTWCNTLARLDPIAIGGLIAMALHRRPIFMGTFTRVMLLGCGVMAWIVVSRFWSPDRVSNLVGAVMGLSLVAWGSAAMLLGVLGARTILGRVLTSRGSVYLGKISYGLYVFHILAITLARKVAWPGNPAVAHSLCAFAAFVLTVGFATASYRWLESPFLRLKARYTHVLSRPGG
jgi:peptidoglycan/LPS O-acetylase OafA/YrhL